MTTKEKYELIDKSQVSEKLLTILQNMEKSSKNFTDEAVNSRVDSALDKIIEGFKAKKPEALRTITEAKKEVKEEKEKAIKKNEGKDFSDKKDTDDKTGLPKKDTLEERKEIIKKESETEKEARERAKKELEKEKEKAKDEIESQIEKLNRLILEDPALRGFNQGSSALGGKGLGGKSNPLIDAERKALPRGSRVSQKGWMNQHGASKGGRKYYENRENRSDRKSPEYETGKPYLAKGGNIDSLDERMNFVIAYNYAKDRRVDSDKSFEEFKEEFKRKTPKSAKYSDKVMKATYYALQQNYAKGGNVYSSDDMYEITIVQDGIELDSKLIRARNKAEARMIFEDMYLDKYQDEFGEFEIKLELAKNKMSRGGGIAFKNFGKTKGRFKLTYEDDGEEQSEIWSSLEEATSSARRYSSPKLGYTNVHIYDETGKEYFFADGGYTESGEKLYEIANNMSDKEFQEAFRNLSEKEKDLYESLLRLGDESKIALATVLNESKKPKYDKLTWDLHRYEKGGEMADGGETEEGKYYVMDAKDGKIVSKGFDTIEEAIVEKFKIFEKTDNFFLTQKKMADGGETEDFFGNGAVISYKENKKNKLNDLNTRIDEINKYLKKIENINTIEANDETNNLIEYRANLQAQKLNLEDSTRGIMAKGGVIKAKKISDLNYIEIFEKIPLGIGATFATILPKNPEGGKIKYGLIINDIIDGQKPENYFIINLDDKYYSDERKSLKSSISNPYTYEDKFEAIKEGNHLLVISIEGTRKQGLIDLIYKTYINSRNTNVSMVGETDLPLDYPHRFRNDFNFVVFKGAILDLMLVAQSIESSFYFEGAKLYKEPTPYIMRIIWNIPAILDFEDEVKTPATYIPIFEVADEIKPKTSKKYAEGGEVEGVDLFEDYDDQPEEVQAILANYDMEDNDYETMQNLKAELESIGYTMDFGLDAEPYDLRKIGQTGKSEFYAKGGKIKSNPIINQYEGRLYDDIWNNWTETQRYNFIKAYKLQIEKRIDYTRDIYSNEFPKRLKDSFIRTAYGSTWKNLDDNVKNIFMSHVTKGQFAKGGEMADGGETEGERLSMGESVYFEVFNDDGKDGIIKFRNDGSNIIEALIAGDIRGFRPKRYMSYLTKKDLERYLNRDFDSVEEVDEEYVQNILSQEAKNKPSDIKVVKFPYPEIASSPEVVTIIKKGDQVFDYDPENGDFKTIFFSLDYEGIDLRDFLEDSVKLPLEKLSPETLQIIEIIKENDNVNTIVDSLQSKGLIKNYVELAEGGEVDFSEKLEKMRNSYNLLEMKVKARIASAIGIDDAIRIMGNDYAFHPFDLITSAVRSGLLELDEINRDLVYSALMEAENVTEDYRDSGQGIGSSDMTYFTKNVLDGAGYKTGFISNRLKRVDEKGNELVIDKYEMEF